jgi:uncharacterized membrane protein
MALYDFVLWFFVYSAYGWCYETIFCSLQADKFVNRGFFFGPYLPIYGFGALFVIILLHKRMSKIHQFILSLIVTTALEYITSYLLEVIFHRTWWNYNNYPFQLHGRICLLASILFGFLGVLLINYIQPRVKKLTDKTSKRTKIILSSTLLSGICVDLLFSVSGALD